MMILLLHYIIIVVLYSCYIIISLNYTTINSYCITISNYIVMLVYSIILYYCTMLSYLTMCIIFYYIHIVLVWSMFVYNSLMDNGCDSPHTTHIPTSVGQQFNATDSQRRAVNRGKKSTIPNGIASDECRWVESYEPVWEL